MDINSTIEDEVMSELGSHQPEGDLPQKDIDQSQKQEVSNSIINALEIGYATGHMEEFIDKFQRYAEWHKWNRVTKLALLKLIISKKEGERITSILGNECGNVDLWIKVL
ncbi:hypothetical protein A3Q56_06359 [Intoshia linei]|uniref:Uncharacterized protein n=1 Tax=Intoshia linei TaxID=1819745 RepID=A0A177AWY2_9BILA|nr:hypothetical protein A3Q56_06359 [Intoshia linei]